MGGLSLQTAYSRDTSVDGGDDGDGGRDKLGQGVGFESGGSTLVGGCKVGVEV